MIVGSRGRCQRATWVGLWLAAVGLTECTYDVPLGTVTYELPVVRCGTWDRLGTHTRGVYFVGHTSQPDNDTVSYFVFDLTPVAGRTVATAGLTLPGTPDWQFTVTTPQNPPLQFRLGVRPLPPSQTFSQVTDGNHNPSVYQDVAAESDLGFAWTPSGDELNTYGAFSYGTGRLQSAVDVGGLYSLFGVQDYGAAASTNEYLFGGGVCNAGIVLTVTVN